MPPPLLWCGLAACLLHLASASVFQFTINRDASSGGAQLVPLIDEAIGSASDNPAATLTYSLSWATVPTNTSFTLAVYTEAAFSAVRQDACDAACKLSYASAWEAVTASPQAGNIAIWNTGQPSYFFFAFILPSGEALSADVSLHVLFADGGELPYDSLNLPQTYVAALVVSALLFFVLTYMYPWMRARVWSGVPFVCKLFIISEVLWMVANTVIAVHWYMYMQDGQGSSVLEGVGRVCDIVSRILNIAAAISLARTWGVRVPWSPFCSRIAIAFVIAFIACLYMAMAAWYLDLRDPFSTVYVYDSAPGIVLCVFQGIVALWFLAECTWQLQRHRGTPMFRYFLGTTIAYLVYLLLLPVSVGIGSSLPNCTDSRVVEMTMVLVTLAFYVVMTYFFRASRVAAVFAACRALDTMEGNIRYAAVGAPGSEEDVHVNLLVATSAAGTLSSFRGGSAYGSTGTTAGSAGAPMSSKAAVQLNDLRRVRSSAASPSAHGSSRTPAITILSPPSPLLPPSAGAALLSASPRASAASSSVSSTTMSTPTASATASVSSRVVLAPALAGALRMPSFRTNLIAQPERHAVPLPTLLAQLRSNTSSPSALQPHAP